MASLTKTQVLIMAATAGICVANVYYSQPILNAIAQSFHVPIAKTGAVSILSQIGYGVGLFFLTPIGDMLERKRLILYLQTGLILSLLLIAFSSNLLLLYTGSFLIGCFSVVAQVVLPMAASLVSENRGKVVGQIFTGLLIGILVARVFSGFVAGWLGWHYVYAVSAIMVGVTAFLMQADFPSTKEHFSGNYLWLLQSTVAQLSRFKLLRKTALTGMLAFGILSAFWITLTFYLSDAPFHYSASQIGLFGFVAVAGALIAPVVGKLADKGSARSSLLLSTGLVIVSIVILKLFPDKIVPVWITIILLDMGVQAIQVTNIAVIYTLDHTANSRINTVYMTSYFIGGALGAFLSVKCYAYGGWPWSLGLMLILGIIAFVNVLTTKQKA